MGSDLYRMGRETRERDGSRYRSLREALCDLLQLDVAHDVTGPGDHQGATDAEIVREVRRLVETKHEETA